MANAVTAFYQKQGINFKSTVFNIALSGNYAAPEVVTLTSAASNPSAANSHRPGRNPAAAAAHHILQRERLRPRSGRDSHGWPVQSDAGGCRCSFQWRLRFRSKDHCRS